MSEIDPKKGWGPEDVIGAPCRVVLSTYEDGQGIEKNGVDKVLKPSKRPAPKTAEPETSSEDEEDFSKIPF